MLVALHVTIDYTMYAFMMLTKSKFPNNNSARKNSIEMFNSPFFKFTCKCCKFGIYQSIKI